MEKQKNDNEPSNILEPSQEDQDVLERALSVYTADKTSVREHIDDIRLMLTYCRNAGIAVSKVVHEFLTPPDAAVQSPDQIAAQKLEKVLSLHEQLCAIIVPVTPRSLAATDFWGKRRKGDFRVWMTEVLFLIFFAVAVYGLVCYVRIMQRLAIAAAESSQVVGVKDPNSQADEPTTAKPSDPNSPGTRLDTEAQLSNIQTSYLCAAVLGAALSGLFTMQHYIRARTFEPNYFFVYLIRFAVGAVAGVVLANFGAGLFDGNGTISKLGPSGIALLGGYSAEAVRQILDRLVQVLVTTVKGRDPAAEKMAVAKELLSIAEKKGDDPTKPKAIETVVADLIKQPDK